jgi:hypothetical protein
MSNGLGKMEDERKKNNETIQFFKFMQKRKEVNQTKMLRLFLGNAEL